MVRKIKVVYGSNVVHVYGMQVCAFGLRFTAGTPLFPPTDRQDP